MKIKYLLIFLLLVLTACDNDGEPAITLDRDSAEEITDDDFNDNDDDTPSAPEEVTEEEDDGIEYAPHDEKIQEQFTDVTEPFEQQFDQNAITVGMNQEMIERKFGPYDFVLMESDGIKVIYGNIAVKLIHGNPSGEGLLGNPSIDPVTNVVTDVFYFANVSQDELIEAFGSPDEIVDYGDNPHMNYYYTDNENNTYTVRAEMTHEGESFVVNTVKRITPDGKYTSIDDSGNEAVTFEQLEAIVIEFMDDYEQYHQDGSEDVYEHVRQGSQAMRNIQSVDYDNYVLEDVVVNYKFDHNDGTVTVNANIYFDHDGLDNRQNATMIFTIDQRSHQIIDFSAFATRDY